MPIILNEEQESLKYDLLKQSLRDDVGFRMNKNFSYSNQKDSFTERRAKQRPFEQQISDWNSDTSLKTNTKKRFQQFMLPQMKSPRRGQNIEDLSRQLLKYDQLNEIDDKNKFRLSFLKQMTKINFKRQKPKELLESPKKINLKLQFPDRYEKIRQHNEQVKGIAQIRQNQQHQSIQMSGSFYPKRSSRGLIPSIKKLVNSSFPKKSMFRSQSQRDPYQNTKFFLRKKDEFDSKRSIVEEIQSNFAQKQRVERERKIKLARIQRKLPLNFLSYSHKKNKLEDQQMREREQNKSKQRKIKRFKSPYLNHMPVNSYYLKIDRLNNQSLLHQPKGLSECIFFQKTSKGTEENEK